MINVKPKDIKRSWHLVDAKNKVLGRLSTEVATTLMGKNKSIYTPYLDTGDYVVIVNAKKVALTGKKETQKKYYKHSGYPGGLYVKTVHDLRQKTPDKILRHSIIGMLPKNKIGKQMAKKLFIYEGTDHPYKDKITK